MNLSLESLDTLLQTFKESSPAPTHNSNSHSFQTSNLSESSNNKLNTENINTKSKTSSEEGNSPTSPVIPNPFLPHLLRSILSTVKTANFLPTAENFSLRTGAHQKELKSTKDLLENAFQSLVKLLELEKFHLPSEGILDFLSDKFDLLQDILDELYNKVDFGLNVYSKNPHSEERNCLTKLRPKLPEKDKKVEKPNKDSYTISKISSSIFSKEFPCPSFPFPVSSELLFQNLNGRPQQKWFNLIDNFRPRFVPRLTEKPHAITPLPEFLIPEICLNETSKETEHFEELSDTGNDGPLSLHLSSLGLNSSNKSKQCVIEASLHPYRDELLSLVWNVDRKSGEASTHIDSSHHIIFSISTVNYPPELSNTPLIFVNTSKELREMIDEIKNDVNRVIAIDLEHHNHRSYKGFVCLIQISSRKKDWIIDPFEIFEEITSLNEITTDPRILKIFHGADHDILWLQRDFSVYVVNLFDTFQAARTLEILGGLSLSNLLSIYCKVKAEKHYQMADWRTRPLKPHLIQYARSDTHYLPFIYDIMKNQLLTKPSTGPNLTAFMASKDDLQLTENGISTFLKVMEASREVCLKCYTESPFNPVKKAAQLCETNGLSLDPQSYIIMLNILSWRENLSRLLDESINFIMKDEFVIRLVKNKPTTYTELSSLFRPMSETLKTHSDELLEQVKKGISHPDFNNSPNLTPISHHLGDFTSFTPKNYNDIQDFSNDTAPVEEKDIQPNILNLDHIETTEETKTLEVDRSNLSKEMNTVIPEFDTPQTNFSQNEEFKSLSIEESSQHSTTQPPSTQEGPQQYSSHSLPQSIPSDSDSEPVIITIDEEIPSEGLERSLFAHPFGLIIDKANKNFKHKAEEIYDQIKFSTQGLYLQPPSKHPKLQDSHILRSTQQHSFQASETQTSLIPPKEQEIDPFEHKHENETLGTTPNSYISLKDEISRSMIKEDKAIPLTVKERYKGSESLYTTQKKLKKHKNRELKVYNEGKQENKFSKDANNQTNLVPTYSNASKQNRTHLSQKVGFEAEWMPAAFVDPSKTPNTFLSKYYKLKPNLNKSNQKPNSQKQNTLNIASKHNKFNKKKF